MMVVDMMVVDIDKIYCICMEDRPQKKANLLRQLNYHFPEWNPEVFNAINTRHLKNHHIGCGLSHRRIIDTAKKKNYKNVLVFEEDAVFHKDFRNLFLRNLKDLDKVDWDILYLGACVWDPRPPKKPRTFPRVPNCKYLEVLTKSTCTQALIYNSSCYDYILESIPDNINEMQTWCKKHAAIDQWLMYFMQGAGSVRNGNRKFNCSITSPRLCSQPFLIGDRKQDNPAVFNIKL